MTLLKECLLRFLVVSWYLSSLVFARLQYSASLQQKKLEAQKISLKGLMSVGYSRAENSKNLKSWRLGEKLEASLALLHSDRE
ncbi:hypothetical protein P4050_00600 [Pseudomonas aeruginosa]|nr:hypothetical protein [Pseudomonas aeruginosa]